MLKVFSRLLLWILLLCVLLAVIVPGFGGRSLAADQGWEQFGFSFCELPCFAGMTPNETPYNEAIDLLRRHIPVMENHMFNTSSTVNFWLDMEDRQLAGSVSYSQGLIGEISLTALLPVDHLIAQLGMPDCILPLRADDPHRARAIFWIRQPVLIEAMVSGDEHVLNLDSRIRVLWLRTAQADECVQRGALLWRGFAPIWEYAR